MISTVYHMGTKGGRKARSEYLDKKCHLYLFIPSSNVDNYPRRFFCGNLDNENNLNWMERMPPPVQKYDSIMPCGIYFGRHALVMSSSLCHYKICLK